MADNISKYGLKALPADQEKCKPEISTPPKPVSIKALQPPKSALAKRIRAYCESQLPAETYRHSLRVYSYGCAIARECYPSFELTAGSALDETWFCTAMLHDIGTTPENISKTRLSYEFWAGYHALELLQDEKAQGGGVAERDQAESVAEAIIRHQDVQPKGQISLLTRLIHWGTLLDNIGAVAELVDRETISEICAAYPRKGWCGCFKKTVLEELSLKPYAMVSRIEGFDALIEKNATSGPMSHWDKGGQ
ncbi:cyanamide hydratase [Entomortierella parvispora]|uniref:Cyanamide hydratase n=1 Tax=Entomortierella parvispora TaxID=205924 RepID=A0A9P3GZE3_9FUNG|nr:cyanamide hydratase [Entomortierella parvispora]